MKRKAATGRRCYVCAPIAVDTSAIRAALHRVGIEIVDEQSTPPPAESPLGNIFDILRNVDFVCGVITPQPQIANVLFELGLAAGMQRSVLLIVDKSASIPVALGSFPYVQVPLNDVRALRFYLDLFLGNLERSNRAASQKRDISTTSKKRSSSFQHASDTAQPAGQDRALAVERVVANELGKVGIPLTLNPRYEVAGNIVRPDIIAWIPGMPLEFGSPLIIDVKASKVVDVERTLDQMTLYLEASRLRAAIVLYDDPTVQRTVRLREFYIFILPLQLFLAAIKNETLPQLLVSERNRIVHG